MSDNLDRNDVPWRGRPIHPYRNGEFDGDLRELHRIMRRWNHCDVRPEVAARIFGEEETEAKMWEWATAKRWYVGYLADLRVWRFLQPVCWYGPAPTGKG